MNNEEFQRIVLEELRDLKAGQGRLGVRMDNIENRIGSLEDRMGSLEDRMGSLEVRMDKIEDRMGSLEVRMDKIEDKVGKLEEGQGGILHSLDGLIEQTASLTEFRVEVNAKLDRIIDENRVFKEIIGRHEVDIEMLKKKIC